MKVCVAGLGSVGLPTAQLVKSAGLEVFGYDISDKAVSGAKEQGINASVDWQDIPPCEAYLICVSTLLKANQPDISPVFDIAQKIASSTPNNAILSIESTVYPGICRRLGNEIIKSRLKIVHVPHRYWAGDPVNHGARQLRVIGGINEESLKAGLKLYRDILDVPLHVCSSIEVAEACKIVENTHRYMLIAYSEDIRMLCEEANIDFEKVREACNTKWNVDMLEAREGVGGHCLPKDIWYVMKMGDSPLLKSFIETDKRYRHWLGK
jgi:UDP-N-acetyl-D-mannosaminuronic acid dehydrogenase